VKYFNEEDVDKIGPVFKLLQCGNSIRIMNLLSQMS
jgi:hypothetical protein